MEVPEQCKPLSTIKASHRLLRRTISQRTLVLALASVVLLRLGYDELFHYMEAADSFVITINVPSEPVSLTTDVPVTVTMKNTSYWPISVPIPIVEGGPSHYFSITAIDENGHYFPCPGDGAQKCTPICSGSSMTVDILPGHEWTATGSLNKICHLGPGLIALTENMTANVGDGKGGWFSGLPTLHGVTGTATLNVVPYR